MNKLLKIAAAASAALAFGAHAGTIDDFSLGQSSVSQNSISASPTWSSSGFSSNILGGYRDISVQKVGNEAYGVNGAVTAAVANGFYTFSTDAGVYAVGKIVWDGVNNAATGVNTTNGLNNANLASGNNAFVLTVAYADLGFPFSIDIYTSATQYSTFTTTALGAGTFTIPFACFLVNICPNSTLTFGSGGAANFSTVNAVVATINVAGATNSVDLTLQNVMAVPEPASVALVGAAMLGLGLARRRSSKSSK